MIDTMQLIGTHNEVRLVVSHADTAAIYGSGSLEVFATPAMIALMEKTCLESVNGSLDDGCTTVGTHIDVSHLKASPIGSEIRCESTLVEVDRRRLVFKVQCFEGENLIGEGKHERFIVDSEKFMAKLKG